MDPLPNRREAFGVLGAAGALAALAPTSARADLPSALPGPGPERSVRGRMTGAQAAVAALCCECVPCVFGVPGAQNNEFWDAMKSAGMPYLLVTNESSASVMADGAARATGGVGVFSVVPGPGMTNSLTGIGEALLDSVPIVGLVTDIDRRPGAPSFQVHSTPNAAVLRPLCKGVLDVRHPAQIPFLIRDAFRIARAGEPGPVAVVLPFPLLLESWDYDGVAPPPYPAPFDEPAYRRAVGLLSDRRARVGIYAGMGCQDAGPALACAAEILQAPVATSVSGKGAIPDRHPLAVGWGYGAQGTRAAEKAFGDVDLVLAVGVKYSENSTASYAIPKHDRVIHVDANPANLGRNVPADVCVQADAGQFLGRLVADAGAVRRPTDPGLARRIARHRDLDRRENTRERITEGVDPMLFLLQLRCALGPDELIFVDVTAASHWAAEAISVPGPRRFFTPANNQSMGWAIPAALGAQRVRPDRMVASISGDGCFLMSGLEMSTAAPGGAPGQVLRAGRRGLSLHADAPGADLPADHRHRAGPDRFRPLRRRDGPGLQRHRAQRRPPGRGGPGGRPPRADPDPGGRKLRGAGDPLARGGQVGVYQALAGRPEGPDGGPDRRPVARPPPGERLMGDRRSILDESQQSARVRGRYWLGAGRVPWRARAGIIGLLGEP